jgi:WD40 repeat protein
MAFSKDGRYLAIGCADGSLPILDIATRRAIQVLKPRAGAQSGAALHISAGSRDGQDCWLTTHAGKMLSQWSAAGELLGQAGLEASPTCLAVHAEQGTIAVGDEKGRVLLFSSTLEPLSIEQAHAGPVLQLAFLQGERSLISAGDDKMLKTNGI